MDKTTILLYTASRRTTIMFYYKIIPKSLPKIQFAHYFIKTGHSQRYNIPKPDIEIVYVKNGYLDALIDNKSFRVPEGGILIYCRHYKAYLCAEKNVIHMHYTADMMLDYDCEITENANEYADSPSDCLLVPFFILPGKDENHLISKLLCIITDHTSSPENDISCGIALLGLLSDISQSCKNKLYDEKKVSSSSLCRKVKNYVSENIAQKIELSDVAGYIGKTPNYINSVFRKSTGMTIGRYVAKEKVNMIAELRKTRDISFADACSSVGIDDVSYGYRLFKKYMGVTPKRYFSSSITESDREKFDLHRKTAGKG